MAQTKSHQSGTATKGLEQAIDRARGGGKTLSDPIRQPMEQSFGADFSQVKVHTDAESNQLNRALGSRAFTTQQDIFFRQGEYAPENRTGRELLAHELTHVVQQNGSAVQRNMIQRAVGFEFQTGWGVIKKQGWTKKKYKKGEILHDYTNFKATADEQTGTELGAELEWVVDPPIEESAGVDAVDSIMTALLAEVNKLLSLKDRDSFYMNEATGDPADSNVKIYPDIVGGKSMAANPQVTGGIGMAHLLTLFEELGDPGKANKKHQPTLDTLMAYGGQNYVQDAGVRARGIKGSERLKGLVAFLIRYLDMGMPNVPGKAPTWNQALKYAKASTLLLARTDFGQMFQMLPEAEREQYAENPDTFVKLVLDAQGNNLDPDAHVLERGIQGKAPNTKHPNGKIHYVDVTRRQWLTGITQNQDHLSSKGMPALEPTLESMGSLGKKTDQKTDKKPEGGVGEGGEHRGVVMEFRQIKQKMLPDEWAGFAAAVFKYILELNRSKISGGSFKVRPEGK